jgi:hypothetical protein
MKYFRAPGVVFGVWVTSVACQFDDRLLAPRPRTSTEEVSTARPGNNTLSYDSGPALDAGDTADGAVRDALVPMLCPDLNENGTIDFTETLLLNAAFQRHTDAWTAQTAGSADWNVKDGCDAPDSGSVLVTNQQLQESDAFGFEGAEQCVELAGGTTYQIAAQIWIEANQAAGSGGMSLHVFDQPDCAGQVVGNTNALTVAMGMWQAVGAVITTSPTARSGLVTLGVQKKFSSQPLGVLVDNILLIALSQE